MFLEYRVLLSYFNLYLYFIFLRGLLLSDISEFLFLCVVNLLGPLQNSSMWKHAEKAEQKTSGEETLALGPNSPTPL